MSTAGRRKNLSTPEYIRAMQDHGISFEGRVAPELWGEYCGIFQEVRRIGVIKPDDFYARYSENDPVILDLQEQASKLIREAWYCLSVRDNEPGWRMKVELPAFERLEHEIICRHCSKRKRKPLFEAHARGQDETDGLESGRQCRELCACSRPQRAVIKTNDHLSRILVGNVDKYMDHEDIQTEIKDRLPRRRPDRLIGLGPTQNLIECLAGLESRSSPFKPPHSRPDLLYPFLVVEAKTAKASDGNWSSIRRQTAFVERTCIRLQQKLAAHTGGRHQCLVWSFANIGEDWRLYAAVPQDTGVLVFHLWHGNVLHPEGALQLLLIIDFIRDWACDTYRESILACLTRGATNSRICSLGLSGTGTSSEMGDFAMDNSREMLLPPRQALVPLRSQFSAPSDFPDRMEELYEIGALLTADLDAWALLEDIYHWRRWLPSESDPSPWTNSATIRHANQVELTSLRLIVPEDRPALQLFLQACFPDISEMDAANRLLALLCDNDSAISTSLTLESRRGSKAIDSVCDARVTVFFRASLRPTDWQITRQLVVLFCSKASIWSLADVANADMTDFSCLMMDGLTTERIVEAMNELHFVSGTLSASLALGRVPLCLKASPSSQPESRYSWVRYCPRTEDGLAADDLGHIVALLASEEASDRFIVPDVAVPYIQKQRLSYIIQAEQSTDRNLFSALDLPKFPAGGILIKKHEAWPAEVPDFCFLVMRETVDFDNERQLALLLAKVHRRSERYGVEKEGAKFSMEDKEGIAQWVQMLAQTTPLSSDGDGPPEEP